MFKTTRSFELVSILENILVKNRIKNTFLFIYKSTIYFLSQKINLKFTKSNKKLLNLLKKYFKEYFYLYTIISSKNLKSLLKGHNMIYTMTGFNLDVIITLTFPESSCRLYISYNLTTDDFQCHIIIYDKNFNIDENTMKTKEIKNIVSEYLLQIICESISMFLIGLFKNTIERTKYANDE